MFEVSLITGFLYYELYQSLNHVSSYLSQEEKHIFDCLLANNVINCEQLLFHLCRVGSDSF